MLLLAVCTNRRAHAMCVVPVPHGEWMSTSISAGVCVAVCLFGRSNGLTGLEASSRHPHAGGSSHAGTASYTWPGSNWRPSACGADVIATRPQVLVTVVLLDCFTVCSRGQPETPPIYPEHASIMCGAVTGDRLLPCMGKCQCTRAAATGSHDPQLH